MFGARALELWKARVRREQETQNGGGGRRWGRESLPEPLREGNSEPEGMKGPPCSGQELWAGTEDPLQGPVLAGHWSL